MNLPLIKLVLHCCNEVVSLVKIVPPNQFKGVYAQRSGPCI